MYVSAGLKPKTFAPKAVQPSALARAKSQAGAGNQALLRRALQCKLSVGRTDDPLEHEADRVADQVMRMPEAAFSPPATGTALVRRKCSACEDEEATLQRKSVETAPHAAPASVHQTLSSAGRPLDPATRAFFEPRFAADFGGVRIHDDAAAGDSAQAVQALAYTVGNHIAFAPGHHAPGTPTGARLLAHELAHVIQQNAQVPLIGRGAPALTRATEAKLRRFPGGPAPIGPFEYLEEVHRLIQRVSSLERQGLLAVAEEAELAATWADVETTSAVVAEMVSAEATANAEAQGMNDVEGEVMAGQGGEMGQDLMVFGLSAMPVVTSFTPKTPAEILAKTKADAATARVFGLMREIVARHDTPAATAAPTQAPAATPPQTAAATAIQLGARMAVEAASQFAAKTLTQTKTRTRRPDPDRSEDRQGPCQAEASAQRGSHTCHDLFATSVSGTTREWRVTTPHGLSVDFDAMTHGNQLFEMKTGYGHLVDTTPGNLLGRQQTIATFQRQSEEQSEVARACGYSLVWYFNDRHVADIVDGLIRPPVRYVPFPCNGRE